MKSTKNSEFIQTVWEFYQANERDFEWRNSPTSYNVLVSEFMLQQTQTSRVVPKFEAFMEQFCTLEDLAHASWEEVLKLWVGLGYNRRARNLHLTARRIVEEFDGLVPSDKSQLMSLPGIGDYTSSAIRAFAFNLADPFIETNIRTAYIHHFFADKHDITDMQIMAIIELTLDHNNPREWYWALMDYGAYLKQTHGNLNTRSKSYSKQSTFEGSTRQLRSNVLKSVLAQQPVSTAELNQRYGSDSRLPKLVAGLVKEGLIQYNGKDYFI